MWCCRWCAVIQVPKLCPNWRSAWWLQQRFDVCLFPERHFFFPAWKLEVVARSNRVLIDTSNMSSTPPRTTARPFGILIRQISLHHPSRTRKCYAHGFPHLFHVPVRLRLLMKDCNRRDLIASVCLDSDGIDSIGRGSVGLMTRPSVWIILIHISRWHGWHASDDAVPVVWATSR